jgi:hypothetical protein
MGITTMILGESGTGKSTSMRNMDPKNVLLIQSIRKPLPFKSPDWKVVSKEGGNIVVSDDAQRIISSMQRTARKAIVIDDFQYVMANEFMRRSQENGFTKFTDIGRHAWDIITAANELPDDVRVYILSHTNTDDAGNTRLKTIGKMLDEKIVLEGMVTIVFNTQVQDAKYRFSTKNSGSNTVKTPMGLFDEESIDNDLAAVDEAIKTYYGVQ